MILLGTINDVTSPYFEGYSTNYWILLMILTIGGGMAAGFALLAAVAMLCKRRPGWMLSFWTLSVSSFYGIFIIICSSVLFYYWLPFALGLLLLVANTAWLIYFLRARRRYLDPVQEDIKTDDTGKRHLHWGGWFWVVGNLVAALPAVLIIIFIVIDTGGSFMGDSSYIVKVSFLDLFYNVVVIILGISAAVIMLLNRKQGWSFAMIVLGVGIFYATLIIVRDLSFKIGYGGGLPDCFYILPYSIFSKEGFVKLGVRIAFLVYFIFARKQYGVESTKPRQPRLHWPGWIWVTGLFILSLWIITSPLQPRWITRNLNLNLPTYLEYLSDYPCSCDAILYFFFLPGALISAIGMLFRRKTGWVAAIVTLGISSIMLLICAVIRNERAVLWHEIVAESIWFAINAAWLIYFICVRRRYGIKSPHNPTSPERGDPEVLSSRHLDKL